MLQLLNNKLSKMIVFIFNGGCCCFSSFSFSVFLSLFHEHSLTKLITVETYSGKKHTVDKIQMKSSSRSNTYVQNVKFRLYRIRFVFFFSFLLHLLWWKITRSTTIKRNTHRKAHSLVRMHTLSNLYFFNGKSDMKKKITLLLL